MADALTSRLSFHLPVFCQPWLRVSMHPDICTAEDIRKLVDSFYDEISRDGLLAPVFNDVAKVDWGSHLPIMYRFWESMLLGTAVYHGAPFPKHAVLPVQKEHFVRWLALFEDTVDAHFAGPKAEEAKGRAASIADTFAQRMGLLKNANGLGRGDFVRIAGLQPEPPRPRPESSQIISRAIRPSDLPAQNLSGEEKEASRGSLTIYDYGPPGPANDS